MNFETKCYEIHVELYWGTKKLLCAFQQGKRFNPLTSSLAYTKEILD